jgi:hypothetical protein
MAAADSAATGWAATWIGATAKAHSPIAITATGALHGAGLPALNLPELVRSTFRAAFSSG